MSKIIVTHVHPDLDAIMSVWLLMRFDQSRYGDAELAFVPAGKTYKNNKVDTDDNIVHVDTGMGKYDHHQPGSYGTCASELILASLLKDGLVKPDDQAIRAMCAHARSIDLFEDCYYPEAREPRYAFTLPEIIPALHRLQIHDNEAVTRIIMVQLDGVYQKLKDWYHAKEEITRGEEFSSVWGKGIAVYAGSDDVHKVAQRAGYEIVVVADPKSGYVGIKTTPAVTRPLQILYDKIIAVDGPEKWFYHNSGHMVLHGSDKGPMPSPSSLTIEKILEFIEQVK